MSMMFFYFLKIIFNISTSKQSKTYKSYLILIKKNSKFLETQPQPRSQTYLKNGESILDAVLTF